MMRMQKKIFFYALLFGCLQALAAGDKIGNIQTETSPFLWQALFHGSQMHMGPGDELLQGDDDDLLSGENPKQEKAVAEEKDPYEEDEGAAYHNQLLRENSFPSADTCKTCHPQHYEEWSVSPHAYAQMSPVANAMNGKMQMLTSGTIGDFCMRCHSPVSMALEEPIFMSNMDRHPASREGITCVACHRVEQTFGKVVGRIALEEGSIVEPMYGPTGGEQLKEVLASPDYRVVTSLDERGRKIHGDVKKFSYLTSPDFCGGCHEVTLVNGTRLEETFTEYKHSPAAAKGVTCQDCHMGIEPGLPSGYSEGPAAIVGGVATKKRKVTNHMFVGPDYSLIHPGIFPHNADAAEMATIREWLKYDYEAGWGTDAFEDNIPDDYEFPERWASADDRYDAREILKRQFHLLDQAAEYRRLLLQRAYLLGDVEVIKSGRSGIEFEVEVRSGTDGHNAPTGFERMVYLQVVVTDADGRTVFKSGDLDPNGDVRDVHSEYVRNGKMEYDKYLFNMQSKFVTKNVRGTEREQVLGANFSVDPLPFVRPDTNPGMLYGRPLGQRLLKRGIEPLGKRIAAYKVDADQLSGRPPYRADVKLIAGMIPVNLINEVKDAGIDYYMTPRELAEKLVDGFQVLHQRNIVLEKGNKAPAPDYKELLGVSK